MHGRIDIFLKTLYLRQSFVVMETASTDEGRAKPELLTGAYQKFLATSVGEIQNKVLLALLKKKMPTVRKC